MEPASENERLDETDVDFVISGPDDHGVPGLVCLLGIESPGLTACLALAEEVSAILARPSGSRERS